MADGEFIGPGGIVRQTILATAGDHHHQGHPAAALLNGSAGNPGATSAQWNPNIKTEPVVATVATSSQSNYFPTTTYEWKVETDPQQLIQKKSKNRTSATTSQGILQAHQQQQQHQQAPPGTITVSVADIKSIPQAIIAQCSNAWSPNNSAVALTSSDLNNYQTIKWENATPIQAVVATKATTLNTAGLHFISAPAAAAAQTVTVAPSNHQVQPATAAAALGVPGQTMVIHGGGRKSGGSGGGGTIIETFKCEVCNQIFASMNALQSHISQVHEVGMNKRNKKPNSTLHCEYKYSGMSLADSLSCNPGNSGLTSSAVQHAAQAVTPQSQFIIAGTGNQILNNPAGPTFIQAPGSLSITSLQNGISNLTNNAGIILAKSNNSVVGSNGGGSRMKKEKRRNWQCELCHNRFSRKDHLAKHVSAVHEKIRPFECVQCGQKFSQKHHLRAHMLARHEDDKNAAKAFACQQCPKRFTRNDHLERHVESVHEKRKAFECAVCAHQFARKHHLSKHILAVHAKVKPYGCNQCEQSFLQRHHLGAHIMSVHQPAIHEEPDGTKSYVCAICQHRFKRKDHLKKHVETVHEKTRAYACMLCERRFGQKYHLAIHVSAVHEGKKPYACDMCSHKSARKSGLQRHMRTVHNIKNPVIASQPLSSVIMPGDPSNSMSNNPQQQQQPQHQTVTYTVTAQ